MYILGAFVLNNRVRNELLTYEWLIVFVANEMLKNKPSRDLVTQHKRFY